MLKMHLLIGLGFQATGEAPRRELPALHMKVLPFFVGNFCLSGSGSGSRIRNTGKKWGRELTNTTLFFSQLCSTV
jgi:hypothetical protein